MALNSRHAARVERSIQTLRQLTTATLSSLPYHLPVKYTIYVHKAIAAVRNSLINTRSAPSAPDELLRGFKPTRRIFPFGACCMVTQHIDKRTALARAHHTATNTEPKAELGVCMGPDCTTGRTLFLLANGFIVPRRPTTPFPITFTPFDWLPKLYTIRTPLLTDTPAPSEMTLQPVNTVVQLSNTPSIEVIATVTERLPSPLPVDLISSLHIPPSLVPPALPHLPTPLIPPPTAPDPILPLPPTQPTTPPRSIPPIAPVYASTPDTLSAAPIASAPQPDIAPPPLRRSTQAPLPPSFWKGCYSSPELAHSPSNNNENHAFINAIQRRIQNAKDAAIRNRHHRQNIGNLQSLNNRATSIEPIPLPPHRAEMSIRLASKLLPENEISASITKELNKHFQTYESFTLIPRSSVEPTAIFLRSQMFIKKKSNGLVTARLAIDGSHQPRESYNETYAGTSNTTNRAFILAAYLADATSRHRTD